MSNRDLDDKEMNKVFRAFEDYANGANGGLAAFIRALWSEAYDLGSKDATKINYSRGFDAGRRYERNRNEE